VPARAVAWRDPASGETRRMLRLPDPNQDAIMALAQRIEELEAKVRELDRERVPEC
jgi:serine O-acetyltransferase